MRIRTRRQAEVLRQVAAERIRQRQFKVGDRVYVTSLTWAWCSIDSILTGTKPYYVAYLRADSGSFFHECLIAAHPNEDDAMSAHLRTNPARKLLKMQRGRRA